jgi:hypothetical protein
MTGVLIRLPSTSTTTPRWTKARGSPDLPSTGPRGSGQTRRLGRRLGHRRAAAPPGGSPMVAGSTAAPGGTVDRDPVQLGRAPPRVAGSTAATGSTVDRDPVQLGTTPPPDLPRVAMARVGSMPPPDLPRVAKASVARAPSDRAVIRRPPSRPPSRAVGKMMSACRWRASLHLLR